MQTVNFSCPLCDKLMGVGAEHLGKQVRCPHCQQVIVAPPATAPEHTVPEVDQAMTFQTATPAREEESIFAPPEVTDDLFNAPAQGPQVEMPPHPDHPPASVAAESPELTAPDVPVAVSAPMSPADERTVAYMPQPSVTVTAPMASYNESSLPTTLAPPPDPWADAASPPQETELIADAGMASATRLAHQAQQPSSVLPILVLIFLVPYALFSTGVAIYLYYVKKDPPSPLEMMPDWPGDHPGASRNQSGAQVIDRVDPEKVHLPDRLKVALGNTLSIGDLAVTPLSIEQRPIAYVFENSMAEPAFSSEEALVLNLKLRNISEDVTFVPTDPAFFQQWTGKAKPYTLLDIGGKKFFGGACPWSPRGQAAPGRRESDPREYVQGQEAGFRRLKPGQEVQTLVCSDPKRTEVIKAVRSHTGPIVWRVQLRRGLVKVKEREVAASAVVGVVFEAKDIKQ